MQLKTFTANTAGEAMNLVRDELGGEAIIVSTQPTTDGKGVRIVASLDPAQAPYAPAPRSVPEAELREPTVLSGIDVDEAVCHALALHGTPGPLTERLAHSAALASGDAYSALATALDGEFRFGPVPSARDGKPVMLVGAPGAGKTVTTAKLATRASLAGYSVGVISTDSQRAGANEQLAAFTRILKLDLEIARTPDKLPKALDRLAGCEAIYIDTSSQNPFLESDMASLAEWTGAADVEPLLVMPAGGDVTEAGEMALAFAEVGAQRLIATRLDVTRRLGSILAAARQSRLCFSGVSITPRIANGLSTINAVSMARLLMPETASKRTQTETFHHLPFSDDEMLRQASIAS